MRHQLTGNSARLSIAAGYLVVGMLGMSLLAGCSKALPQASAASTQVGRYVVVHSPQVERDTVLLDTATGQTWQLGVANDLKGEPSVWLPVPQINSDADRKALVAKFGAKPSAEAFLGPPPAAPDQWKVVSEKPAPSSD